MVSKAPVAAPAALDNSGAKALFLATALRRSQMVTANQTYAPGVTLSAPLPAAGIGRYVTVAAQIPITITAPATPSPKMPFNMFSNIRIVDYSGIDRVNASPYALYLLSLLKHRGWDPGQTFPFALPLGSPQSVPSYVAGTRWNIPTGAGAGTVNFSFQVPLSFDDHDTRGGLLMAVPNGRTMVYLTCAPVLWQVNTTPTPDAPYTGAAGGAVALGANPVVTIGYYYWEGISVPNVDAKAYPGGVPIPYDDLALVHEVRTTTDTSNLAPSQEKLWTAQSGRDYYAILASLVEAGVPSSAHLARLRWLYDGNTPTLDESAALYFARIQRELERDLPDGTMMYDFRNRPWDANSYGSLALGLTLSAAFTNTGTTYLEITSDAMYVTSMANA